MSSPSTAPAAPSDGAAVVETDVLVVGSGPAGIGRRAGPGHLRRGHPGDHLVGRLADTPRAHITNQRTMEVLRDLGVEEEVAAEAAPQELMGNLVYCTRSPGRSWAGCTAGAPGPTGWPTTPRPPPPGSATCRRT